MGKKKGIGEILQAISIDSATPFLRASLEALDDIETPSKKNNPLVDSRSQREYNPAAIGYWLQTVTIGNQNSLVGMAYFKEKKATPKRRVEGPISLIEGWDSSVYEIGKTSKCPLGMVRLMIPAKCTKLALTKQKRKTLRTSEYNNG
jgi:hypothetical protein